MMTEKMKLTTENQTRIMRSKCALQTMELSIANLTPEDRVRLVEGLVALATEYEEIESMSLPITRGRQRISREKTLSARI